MTPEAGLENQSPRLLLDPVWAYVNRASSLIWGTRREQSITNICTNKALQRWRTHQKTVLALIVK